MLIILSSFFFILLVYCEERSHYCDPYDILFQTKNKAQLSSSGKWLMNASIMVPITPGDELDLTFVSVFPFYERNTYDMIGCEFISTLVYYIVCTSTNCPLLTSGTYIGLEQINAQIIIPDHYLERIDSAYINQKYKQKQVTPPLPQPITDVSIYNITIEAIADDHIINIYRNSTTNQTVYREIISIDIPNKHRYYQTITFGPSPSRPGLQIPIIVAQIESIQLIPDFPEPIKTAYLMYDNGTFPFIQYAPGKSSYLWLLS